MYCPQCGSVNDESVSFCTKCGFNLDEHRKQWMEPVAARPPEGAPDAGGQLPEGQVPAGQVPEGQVPTPPPASAPPPYQQQYQPTYQTPPYQSSPPYQSPPPYQAGGYYQPAGYQQPGYRNIPHIPSYMGWAIATLILCFWPTGIVAVVYASKVGNRLAIGDVPGAQEASRKAKMWSWITFAIAIFGIVVAIIGTCAVAVNSGLQNF